MAVSKNVAERTTGEWIADPAATEREKVTMGKPTDSRTIYDFWRQSSHVVTSTAYPVQQIRAMLLIMGLLLALVSAVMSGWDANLSFLSSNWPLPGDLRKAIDLSEVFGHGAGATAILVSIYLIATNRRSVIGVAILITLLSGLAANGLKICFVKIRPYAQGTIQVITSEDQAAVDAPSSVELVSASFWDARQRSFPSGHAATAWGLAIGLSLVFPRGWPLFTCFACLASLQRLTSGAHFASDVLAGAGIAFLSAAILLSIPALRNLLPTSRFVSRSSKVY
jgi:membrane-associated phospholipid phosphatase